VVNEVYRVIVGRPGHPDQFPYIDCWQDAVLSQSTWLRPCLEEAFKIMVARVAAASKCREKSKEPVLAEEPEEVLYPPLPPVTSSAPLPLIQDGGNSKDSHTCKIWFRSLGGLNSSEPP
jgi:hypothetical protein